MIKRILLLAILTHLCIFTVKAYDFTVKTVEGKTLYYTLTSATTCEVACWSGNASSNKAPVGKITIPSQVQYRGKNLTVSGIGRRAFEYSGVTSVVIPNSVTYISERAFFECYSITAVTIPSSVKQIGETTFHGCDKLAKVTLNAPLTEIAYACFSDCSSLTSIQLPPTVTTIYGRAFDGCKSLRQLTLPNALKEIRSEAFRNSGIKSITLPEQLEEIGMFVFAETDIETVYASYGTFPNIYHAFPSNEKNIINATLFVPRGMKSKYENTDIWKTFWNIEEFDSPVYKAPAERVQTLESLDPDYIYENADIPASFPGGE